MNSTICGGCLGRGIFLFQVLLSPFVGIFISPFNQRRWLAADVKLALKHKNLFAGKYQTSIKVFSFLQQISRVCISNFLLPLVIYSFVRFVFFY